MERNKSRAWREIDLSALAHNVQALKPYLAPGQELMAVVKADAYGHGAVQTVRYLERCGVQAFAVACLSEGIVLRQAGIRGDILILGYTPPEEAGRLAQWDLVQAVADETHGLALAAQGISLRVHIALDTGMHRLGVPADNYRALCRLFSEKALRVEGTFSHLCVSDNLEAGDAAYTQGQLDAFYSIVGWLRESGHDPGAIHIQSSYGLLNLPPQPCRYARAGILLYGVPSDRTSAANWPDLRPVLSLRARVASVRTLATGESAGYGLDFHADRDTRLAVVTIGYGDGLPRALAQSGGQVLIGGKRCPMVGRMCMDQLLVDVTDVCGVSPGDVVTLIGQDESEDIGAVDLAEQCGTITNELLSRLGPRLPVIPVCG